MRYDAGEVITAMVTPFNEKREIDYDKVEQPVKLLHYHMMKNLKYYQVQKELFQVKVKLLWVPVQTLLKLP